MKYFLTVILILLTVCSFGQQHPAVSQPGYNPTVPRLISMQHKAVSHLYIPEKPSVQDFNQKINSEEVNVFMVYTRDSTVGSTYNNNSELFYPPRKLMDLFLIYDYRIRIHIQSKEMITGMIPAINLSGGFLAEVKLVNYFLDEKGKLKDKKLKKSALNIAVNDGFLTMVPDISLIEDNSMIDLNIQIKSRFFNTITPTITNDESFAKSLIISYPSIFKYKFPDSQNYEIASKSSSSFELLHFRRDTGAGNGHIDIVKTESIITSFKFIPGRECDMEFEMDGLTVPSQYDIGILPTDIVKVL